MPYPTTIGAGLMGYPSTVDSGGVVPWSLELGDIGLSSTNTLTANTAYFAGVTLPAPAILTGLRANVIAGGHGNYDIGIYDVNGNLLNNKGATTTTSVNLISYSLATAISLSPGRYWLAFWIDNATDTISTRGNITNFEVTQSVSASSHLPSTMSGSANANIKVYMQAILSGAWS